MCVSADFCSLLFDGPSAKFPATDPMDQDYVASALVLILLIAASLFFSLIVHEDRGIHWLQKSNAREENDKHSVIDRQEKILLSAPLHVVLYFSDRTAVF